MKQPITILGAWVSAVVLTSVALAQPPGPPPGPARNPLFMVFDTDHDGILSPAEIDAAPAKLRELDTNKDGRLNAPELRPRGGGPPPGTPGGGNRRMTPSPNPESSAGLETPPRPRDDSEKRILDAIQTAREGQRYANVSTSDGRLLRILTESINAKRVVELGTSTGESGLWFALALRKTGGHLFTHDIDPGRIAVARENFKRAGVDELITIVEGDAHVTAVKNTEPIDVLFIDAEKPGYPAYLAELLPLVRPGGLIIAHNMHQPPPDKRYIEAITNNPALDTSFVLMDGAGIGVTIKKR